MLAVFKKRVDVIRALNEAVEEPFRVIVLKPCLNELKALKEGRKIFPKVEYYLRENGVETVKTAAQSADKALFDYAQEKNAVVCTNDWGLKQKLKKVGMQVITLKNNKLVLV